MMLMYSYGILILVFISLQTISAKDSTAHDPECSVKLTPGDPKDDIYKNNLHWKEPSTNRTGDIFSFKCNTGFISGDFPGTNAVLKCVNGKYNGKYLLPDLLCRSDFHSKTLVNKVQTLNSSILQCSAQGWAIYEVSSKTPTSEKPLYRVCLDTNTMRPKFSFRLSSSQVPVIRHQTRNDVWGYDGYGKTVEDKVRLSQGYVKNVQQHRTTRAFSDKYNQGKKYPYYFNRGHLTAYTDLHNEIDQKTTVEYINAAPQWDVLNENSWSLVEREVRAMLKNNPENWEIYTGTYGKMPTPKGTLFLSPIFDSTGKFIKGQLPVPLVFWKLAYNTKDSNQTRVFIGVNNPEFRTIKDITPLYKLCQMPIRRENKLVQGDEFKGFTYECFVDEFLAKLNSEENVVVQKKH